MAAIPRWSSVPTTASGACQPYGANMVPDARISDRTFTRDATSDDVSGSTVRELARRPLSSGLAAMLFAVCTLLIVLSVSWQRLAESGDGGSARPGAAGPREAARHPRPGYGDVLHSKTLRSVRSATVVVVEDVAAASSARSVASAVPSTDVPKTPPQAARKHRGRHDPSRRVERRANRRDRTKTRPTREKPPRRRSESEVKPLPWAY